MTLANVRRASICALLFVSGCAESGADVQSTDTTSSPEPDTSTGEAAESSTSLASTTAGSSGDDASGSDGQSDGDATSAPGGGTFGMPAEPMPCPADVEPGTLEIGHGSGQFVDLVSGPAQLVHGRQGGFHIVLGVRAPGLDTSGPGTAHLRGIVDGEVLAEHPFVANLTCEDESVGAQALWINLVLESTPAELDGKTVDIEVEIVDAQGTSVSGTASVAIVDPEAAGP